MPFAPEANQVFMIDRQPYRVAEHPAAPGMPYGQEGRQAVVYQLIGPYRRSALKVFRPSFRHPSMVSLAAGLAPFADQPGLEVCRRTVLTPHTHADLVRQNEDLKFAVLMPWVSGPTWMEMVLDQKVLAPEQSLQFAGAMANTLAAMEARGLAHCDLSGPNVILPILDPYLPAGASALPLALIDVEQLYGPGLIQPALLPAGSPGYAHRTAAQGLWGPLADRFAGAILLVEMLAWCVPELVDAAWSESFFDPDEMQQPSARFQTLYSALSHRWGDQIAQLFARTWQSPTLADCPTYGEWIVALPVKIPRFRFRTDEEPAPPVPTPAAVRAESPADRQRQEEYRQAVWGMSGGSSSSIPTPAGSTPSLAPTIAVGGVSVMGPAGGGWSTPYPPPAPPPVAPPQRARMLLPFMLGFLGLGLVVWLGLTLFSGSFTTSIDSLRSSVGQLGVEATGGLLYAVAIGALELWVFSRRTAARRRLPFVSITALAGLAGGATSAALALGKGSGAALLTGAVAGAIAGTIAGFGQSLLLRDRSLRVTWTLSNALAWAAVWSIAWLIAARTAFPVGEALAAGYIIAATGLVLMVVLYLLPNLEL